MVAARSYYNLPKTHALPACAQSKRVEMSVSGSGRAASVSCGNDNSATTLLSRPPSAQSLHVLPELSEDMYAPVPVRTPPVPRALPALTCSRSPSQAEGSVFTSASHALSPDSAFRPISSHVASHSPREGEAATPEAAEETRVKPLLCPPMKPGRTAVMISSAVRTNPFCPEGVHVKHLPSCSPRMVTSRLHGRHTTVQATTTTSASATWDDAASDADVLAFFGTTNVSATTPSPTFTSGSHHSGKRDSKAKELSWPGADTTQSSICELSFSEDMFSIGATSSDGSTSCGGSHRSNVMDLEALASFQRSGARRQRELVGVATAAKTVAH
jgi:hypothetical protein